MKLDIRRCAKNGNYYLQCVIEERAIDRKIDEMNRIMTKAAPADREAFRLRLAELRQRRSYIVDYIPLEEGEIPPGVKVRNMPSVPSKIVSVDRKTKRWLLEKFHTKAGAQPLTETRTVHYYDLPAEDGKEARS